MRQFFLSCLLKLLSCRAAATLCTSNSFPFLSCRPSPTTVPKSAPYEVLLAEAAKTRRAVSASSITGVISLLESSDEETHEPLYGEPHAASQRQLVGQKRVHQTSLRYGPGGISGGKSTTFVQGDNVQSAPIFGKRKAVVPQSAISTSGAGGVGASDEIIGMEDDVVLTEDPLKSVSPFILCLKPLRK